jgi:hypothetical protein
VRILPAAAARAMVIKSNNSNIYSTARKHPGQRSNLHITPSLQHGVSLTDRQRRTRDQTPANSLDPHPCLTEHLRAGTQNSNSGTFHHDIFFSRQVKHS